MMKKNECDESNPTTFKNVLGEELSLLSTLRKGVETGQGQSAYDNACASNLAGLALSGGGIRSATFNLGIIQALARYGLLSKFDYLSTVSGGGYIGGWLSALLHRKATVDDRVDQGAVESFQTRLEPHPRSSGNNKPDTTVGFSPVEHMAMRYLRCYSNYLSPKLGLSGDMLAVISIFLRNFTLIQLGLVSLVASILLFAHVIVAGSNDLAQGLQRLSSWLQQDETLSGIAWPAWLAFDGAFSAVGLSSLGGLSLVIAGWSVSRLTQYPSLFGNRRSDVERRRIDELRAEGERRTLMDRRTLEDRRLVSEVRRIDERRKRSPKLAPINRAVSLCIIFPCGVGAWAFSVAITQLSLLNNSGHDVPKILLFGIPAVAALCYIIGWILSYPAANPQQCPDKERKSDTLAGCSPSSDVRHRFTLLLVAAISGLILGLLLFAALCYVAKTDSAATVEIWHAVAFGPPLFLLGLLFTINIHMGGVRRAITEHYREWLARLCGFLLLYAVAWTLIFALVLYAAPLVHWLAGAGLSALGVWASGSGVGVWLAHSPATGGDHSASPWKEVVSRVAPWLFVGGLAIIVAYVTHIVLMEFYIPEGYVRSMAPDFSMAAASALRQLKDLTTVQVLVAALTTAFLVLIITQRFDINLFSLHALYCNRLARTYLGASRAGERNPNPFTGFDIDDDLPFCNLANQRPIHIINTAINMTGGDDLAWQTRRAASFAITPAWAGFETRSTQGHRLGTYRSTRCYAGGRNLGTWMAVSGAAAGPNMGYHTSPVVAVLLTAFNLRLGRWCGNPVHPNVWDKTSPFNAAQPILAELTGSATAQADWVNLTDGGHFENLGVYELIRRRCRLILVTDAGCDLEHKFEDLANLLRKCWTDLGVNIRFEDFEPVKFKKGGRDCTAHCVIGRIEYKSIHKAGGEDPRDVGILIYLKASLIGDEWPDIRQYADTHKDFPHETTADQFFDENQFEAYRHLGYKVLAKMHEHIVKQLKDKSDKREPKDIAIKDLVDLLMPSMPSDKTSP